MNLTVRARIATTAMASIVLSLFAAAPAALANADYQQVVDLTFPVEGPVSFIDDYHQPRGGGTRVHRANDIMAPTGARVFAAVGGTIVTITGLDGNPPDWGYAIVIRGDDGRDYTYIHLGVQNGPPSSAYAPGLARGTRVQRGQHIGFNGHSGNASPSAPHLHLEIHDPRVVDPYGSNRINPYASLVAARARGDLPGTPWNLPGAVPLTGDWNGDGVDTPGWFHDGRWWLRDAHASGPADRQLEYGRAGDIPVVGDWNGDGRDTVGVVREIGGELRFILRRTYVSGDDVVMTYGRRGDIPVVGDWNGDGRDTLGVARPVGNSLRFLLRYEYRSGADIVLDYGRPGDTPVTGDFNGDGTDTLGVVRDGRFILRYVYRSGSDIVLDYGRPTDRALTGDWNGDGADTLGVVRGRQWIMRYVYRSGADLVYAY